MTVEQLMKERENMTTKGYKPAKFDIGPAYLQMKQNLDESIQKGDLEIEKVEHRTAKD